MLQLSARFQWVPHWSLCSCGSEESFPSRQGEKKTNCSCLADKESQDAVAVVTVVATTGIAMVMRNLGFLAAFAGDGQTRGHGSLTVESRSFAGQWNHLRLPNSDAHERYQDLVI